ncbi:MULTISPECIES: PadR family transcriptional regulator [Catenuloplanes]|uniref:DNA-binding PadR family transcriptional regulator n=1 Tax=Catenuloplanes niger TaxID=587534 RepID=A0AAE3ZJK3_9ACTN|nr:helix-turn-helix transcriptional regulator [Catenuloplanes niger]MDR7319839.1 DNA-binding PadR family transcriptional regulator [Catenuloplanes niger]
MGVFIVNPIRVTPAVADVLAVFLRDPAAARYGLDLIRASGHSSGTVYPILVRLRAGGWAEAGWADAGERPARRRYRLTRDGIRTAAKEMA